MYEGEQPVGTLLADENEKSQTWCNLIHAV